jgi:hypothetical protein
MISLTLRLVGALHSAPPILLFDGQFEKLRFLCGEEYDEEKPLWAPDDEGPAPYIDFGRTG